MKNIRIVDYIYELIDVVNWYIEEKKTWLNLKLISSKNGIVISYHYSYKFLKTNRMNFNLTGVLLKESNNHKNKNFT